VSVSSSRIWKLHRSPLAKPLISYALLDGGSDQLLAVRSPILAVSFTPSIAFDRPHQNSCSARLPSTW